MADIKPSGGGEGGNFKFFLIALGILFILWLMSGGPNQPSRFDKFIHSPNGLNIGKTYDEPVTIFGRTF